MTAATSLGYQYAHDHSEHGYEKCKCGKHEFQPFWWDNIKVGNGSGQDPLEHQEIHQPGRNNGCLRYDFKERKYKPIG